MTAIEIQGLTKRYGSTTAVDGVDLVVDPGEVFGFLGPNGAGKSTTINVLLGFLEPTTGRATVLGHDATDESRAVRSRVGLLPEGFATYENLTGREHVASAIRTKNANDDPDDLLERVGLDPDDARRATGEYSKGMSQRLGLAIALVGDPDLLVLDEPSSGLDPNGVKRLRRLVREETERGATVFFSSHVLGEVENVCDRVGIMNAGDLVAVDTIDDLRDQVGLNAVVEATVADVPDLAAVRDVEGVQGVSVDGETVRVACASSPTKMDVLRLLDKRTTVRDIALTEGSLESLFDAYAGGEPLDSDSTTAKTADERVAAPVGEVSR